MEIARPLVEIDSGPVRGVTERGCSIWRGIPYGGAISGGRRWRIAQLPDPWSEPLDAARFGPRFPQPTRGVRDFDDEQWQSENALVLNVTAPAHAATRPLPVLVWIHGGGFRIGSGPGIGTGDGRALAQEGMVVVTFNYRLGVFGFLSIADVLGDDWADSGNAGLLDQIELLRWVRRNIHAFGGDPQRVTIAGVSAGAKSVIDLMAAPDAAGLFHRAISMSGGDHVATPAQADSIRGHFLAALRAEGFGADELLSAPTGALLAAQLRLGSGARDTWIWRPMIDGRTLSCAPTVAFEGGDAARVPLIAGTTRREGAYYQARDASFAAHADAVLGEVFGAGATRALEAYRACATSLFDADGEIDARVQIGTDERYGFPTRRLLDAHSRHAPVWRYRFDAATPGLSPRLRAGHGADVPYLLSQFAEEPDDAALSLATRVQEFVANFVRSGSPAGAGGLAWDSYDERHRATLMVDEPMTIATDPDADLFALWEGKTWVPGEWWDLPAGASPGGA